MWLSAIVGANYTSVLVNNTGTGSGLSSSPIARESLSNNSNSNISPKWLHGVVFNRISFKIEVFHLNNSWIYHTPPYTVRMSCVILLNISDGAVYRQDVGVPTCIIRSFPGAHSHKHHIAQPESVILGVVFSNCLKFDLYSSSALTKQFCGLVTRLYLIFVILV